MAAARFFAKVYNPTGATFRRVLDAGIFTSVPRIVREVGMAAGDLTIDLGMPFDAFGYGQTNGINPFDLVKIYAVNDANPTGYLVYQGHVEELVGTVDQSGNDHVSIRLFPIDALLSRSLWKAAGSYSISYTGALASQILSDAIDAVNSVYGTFFTKLIEATAGTFNASYIHQTHLAAIQSATKNLPATTFWRIRPDGTFELAEWPDAAATHRLTLGKDLDTIQVTKSLLNAKNRIIVSLGPGPSDTEGSDSASIAAYGTRDEYISDPSLVDAPGRTARINGEIARLKDPATKTTLTVNSLYPIEKILPGDTVQVFNLTAGGQQMLSGILRIAHVEYDGSLAVLQLADAVDNFGAELQKMIG